MDPALVHHYLIHIIAFPFIARFHLHLIVDDFHCIHGKSLHPAIRYPFFSSFCHTIYQISSHKAQNSDILPLSTSDIIFFPGLQVQKMQYGCLESLSPLMPGKPGVIRADSIASFFQAVCHHHSLIAF